MSENSIRLALVALKSECDQARNDLQRWATQLVWFQGFSIGAANHELRKAEADVAAAQAQFQQSQREGSALKASHTEIASKAKMGMDPRYWVSSERGIAKKQLVASKKLLDLQSSRDTDLELGVLAAKNHERNCREILVAGREFDPLLAQAAMSALQATIARIEPKLEALQVRSDDLDRKLSDLLESRRTEEAEKARINERMGRAKYFASQLSSGNGFERRQVHEQCSNELGHGSPERVMQKCEDALEFVERNLSKLDDKIAEIVRFAAFDIRHVIIDGNNLCYANGNVFIGLDALESLVPKIEEKYRVTLFFDASIHERTGLSQHKIEKRFSGAIEVHVVPSKSQADDTILELAEHDPHACVLSNDVYRDFPDRMEGKRRRRITHSTLRGFTHVPAMQISAKFGAQQYSSA